MKMCQNHKDGTKAVDSLHLEIKKGNFCSHWSEWLRENNDNEDD